MVNSLHMLIIVDVESKSPEGRAHHEHNVKQTSSIQQQQGTKLSIADTCS